MTERKPEVVVFAGPNGSGKSTLTAFLRPSMDYINADEIKKSLKCSDLEAAQLAEEQRKRYLSERKDFCFETVLSTRRNLDFLLHAKEEGYFIRCYYILTADPGVNVMRVSLRVQAGGHDVPIDKVISRYKKSLLLVSDVIKISDVCHIYDNSEDSPFRIFKKRKDEMWFDECDGWKEEDICLLTGVEEMKKRNLNL